MIWVTPAKAGERPRWDARKGCLTWVREPPRPGAFEVRLVDPGSSRVLLVSRTPFLDAARRLQEAGHGPGVQIVMRHHGTDHDALRSTVGVAAGLRVVDPDREPMKFMRWADRPASWGEDRP